MKTILPLLVFTALLSGCAHPDGQRQTQTTAAAIDRTAAAVHAADAANAQAQAHTVAARDAAQRIDDKAVILENARW